ncbi:MAG: FtsQ-type POTRA domain-containing protein [Lachnospiraceae bacterium]|nr:FtsQ-type POTRA domain-containing protein [Lachnospiraceae bacterium]
MRKNYDVVLDLQHENDEQEELRPKRPKRKKISKFRFYFINIFLGIAIIAILAAIFIYAGCRIQKVSFEGNTVYAEEDLKNALLNDKYSFNSVYVYCKSIFKPVENVPFVESYSVKFNSPTSITIKVKEKSIMAYVPSSDGTNNVYFDEDGVVQEVSNLNVPGALMISGITVDDAKVGKQLDIDADQLEALLSMLKNVKKYDIEPASIYYDESGNLYITYGEGIQIEFGNSNYMAEKVMRLSYILPKLEGMVGTLHLEGWNPENTDIVFEKAQ